MTVRISGEGTGLEAGVGATDDGATCWGGSGVGTGVRVGRTVTTGCAGAGDSILTGGVGRGRKVVWGTGGMVPWGTGFIADARGGMVVVESGASAAIFAVLWLTGGDVEATPVVVDGSVIGGSVLLSCGTCTASPDVEPTETSGGMARAVGASLGWGGTVSVAGIDVEGATIGAGAEEAVTDEEGGLMVALAMVDGASGIGAATAAGTVELVALGMALRSGGVMGGTTVSDGGFGSVAPTAMTSSGLRPSNSAF